MGLLRQTDNGALSVLEAEHVVGRSPRSALVLDLSYVSAQHAQIRWIGNGWELKDLGSRNGTFVNEAPIQAGQAVKLLVGSRVAFGRTAETWELIDESPPGIVVVPLDGPYEPLFPEGDILPLPSQEDPKVTVFRGADGMWRLEREDEIVPLVSHQVFEASGRRFRFSCPNMLAETSTIDWPQPGNLALDGLRLEFRVSKDEEHVEIYAHFGRDRVDVGTRGHNYILLILARQRLADVADGQPTSGCGWMYQDDLMSALRFSPDRLNIDVFRIRKQFARLGVSDPASVVERRPRTKQLRIGVSSLTVQAL
jgi:hypothetical protein